MKLHAKWLLPSLLALALAGTAQAAPPGRCCSSCRGDACAPGCPSPCAEKGCARECCCSSCRGDACAPDCPAPCAEKGCARERGCPPPCAEKPAPRDCGGRPCFAPPPRQNPELREAHHAAMKLARQARAAEGEERERLVAELREQVLRETQLVDQLQEERLDAIEKAAQERIDAMRDELRKMRENQDSFVDGQVERYLQGPCGGMPPPREDGCAPSCDGPRFHKPSFRHDRGHKRGPRCGGRPHMPPPGAPADEAPEAPEAEEAAPVEAPAE